MILLLKISRCYRTLPSATCDNYFIVKFLLKSNITRVILLTNCIKLVKYNLMPTWYTKARAKSASTNFTWLYFVFPNSFWGGSRTAATSKMERFAIIVNGFQLPAVNYYQKAFYLGWCSSPTVSELCIFKFQFEYFILCLFVWYAMVFRNRFIFEYFFPNFGLLLKTCTYLVVDFTVMTYFTSN